MSLRAAALLALLAILLLAPPARAAEAIVRVEISAKQPVLVGQQVGIDVTILAPNFFMSAPDFPALQVPGAVVTMPDARALNTTETIDGVTYAGIRKTYAFTAEQDGDFRLPAATVRVTYAGDDGAPRQGSVTFPPTSIRAGKGGALSTGAGTDVARTLLPVARLVVTQALDHDPERGAVRLHAGDALVRTVTTFAPQTQAMMIHPPHAQAPHSVRVFRADPRLSDHARGAPGPGGTRVDTYTYVFERTGTYTLPPVTVDWFDPATRQPARSEAPAVKVVVAAARDSGALAPGGSAPALPGEGSLPWRTLLWAGMGVLVLLAAALLWWRLRPAVARLRQRLAEHRRARATGANAKFMAVLNACQAGDAAAAYGALAAWTRTAHDAAPAAWAQSVGDAQLAQAVAGLEQRLYGATRTTAAAWDGRPLAASLRRHATPVWAQRHRHRAAALPPLNP
ncbi:BatD family protein [Cupriavidus necator]|uniref:BatD family protein n=1 Tax=Cupriavidus necator TaxID=106590 RepID=UPI00339D57B4